MASIRFADL